MLLSDDVHRVEFKEEEEHVSFIFVFKEKTSVMFSKQEAEEKRKKKKKGIVWNKRAELVTQLAFKDRHRIIN